MPMAGSSDWRIIAETSAAPDDGEMQPVSITAIDAVTNAGNRRAGLSGKAVLPGYI